MNENKEKAPKEKVKQHPIAEAFEYLEILVFAAAAVLLLFTFGIRPCTVDGSSMHDTLENKQMLIVSDILYTPDNGDIVVFHQSDNPKPNLNKPLVKRIIATEGQYLKLKYTFVESSDYTDIYYLKMDVWVSDDATFSDSEKLDESHIDFESISMKNEFNYLAQIYSHYLSRCEKTDDGEYVFETTVPKGHIFVMGDNRFNSDDSRLNVGFVDNRCILGKVALRLSPFGKVQ